VLHDNQQTTIYSSPWFSLVARPYVGSDEPYYVIQAPDCVCVIAQTDDKQILLVEQYRPTIREKTIELPAGHIETGETPRLAARRELLEETGYRAATLYSLGTIAPDTGRLGNKLWCFFGEDLSFIQKPADKDILKVTKCPPEGIFNHIRSGRMIHGQDIAALFLAVQNGKIAHEEGSNDT